MIYKSFAITPETRAAFHLFRKMSVTDVPSTFFEDKDGKEHESELNESSGAWWKVS